MDDKKRVGFLGALKNMFVGVAKPEAYYRNGRFGRMSSAMLITFIMSTLTYLVIFLGKSCVSNKRSIFEGLERKQR